MSIMRLITVKYFNRLTALLITLIFSGKSTSPVVFVHKKYMCCFHMYSKWWMICAYFSPDSLETTFSQEKATLWIEDLHFSRKQRFEVKKKTVNNGFVFYKHAYFCFIMGSLMYWNFVDYGDVVISCLNSHSDSTHSLQKIRG